VAGYTLQLANATCRHRADQEAEYLEQIDISLRDLPFATRLVSLWFSSDLHFNLSTFDMDRIAICYLRLRGVALPKEADEMINAEPPPRCSFVVPMARTPKS
jgi:hypothetical protein